MENLLTPDVIETLLQSPILLAFLYVLWSIQKNNVRLIEVIEKLIEKVSKQSP